MRNMVRFSLGEFTLVVLFCANLVCIGVRWNPWKMVGCPKLHDEVTSVAISDDGKRYASGGKNGGVCIGNIDSPGKRLELLGHKSYISGLSFSPTGQKLISASDDRTARIWDCRSGRELSVLRGHSSGVVSVVFASDEKTVATAGIDKFCILWAWETMQIKARFEHDAAVFFCEFLANNSILITATNFSLHTWDVSGRQAIAKARHGSACVLMAVSRDGRHAMTGSLHDFAVLWRIPELKRLMTFSNEDFCPDFITFGRQGQLIVAPARKVGFIELYDGDVFMKSLTTGVGDVIWIGYTPNEERVFVAGYKNKIEILSLSNNDQISTISVPIEAGMGMGDLGDYLHIRVAKNGNVVVVGGHDGCVYVWRREFSERWWGQLSRIEVWTGFLLLSVIVLKIIRGFKKIVVLSVGSKNLSDPVVSKNSSDA